MKILSLLFLILGMEVDHPTSLSARILKVHELHPLKPVRARLITPKALALIRTIFCLYYIIVLIVYIAFRKPEAIDNVAYLTYLTFYSITSYLLVSKLISPNKRSNLNFDF